MAAKLPNRPPTAPKQEIPPTFQNRTKEEEGKEGKEGRKEALVRLMED
jgi:hypothetical protein